MNDDAPTVPYESTEDSKHLPAHLERIAQRDYVGVNEGYWILRDAAAYIRELQRQQGRDALRVAALLRYTKRTSQKMTSQAKGSDD